MEKFNVFISFLNKVTFIYTGLQEIEELRYKKCVLTLWIDADHAGFIYLLLLLFGKISPGFSV